MRRTARIAFLAAFGLVVSRATFAEDKVFFGNLHSHTSYSDGTGTPAQAYQHARTRAKVDFLLVSEHNHAKADGTGDRKDGIVIATKPALYTGPGAAALIPAAKAATVNGKFVGLYGQEFSTIGAGNHVNVFDVDKVIDSANGDFKALVDWLAGHPDSAGLPPILQLNHPDLFDDESVEYGRDDFATTEEWRTKIGGHAKLLEIIVGPAMTKVPKDAPSPKESHFLRFLNLGLKVAPTANQDNHYRTWGDATPARTAIVAETLSKATLLSALRERHIYATEDPDMRVVFRVAGRLAGEVVAPLASNAEIPIEVSIRDDDEPDASYEIDVFSDKGPGGAVAQVIDTVTVQGNTTTPVQIEDVRSTGAGQYVFFRVRQRDEEGNVERAWIAPTWFEATGVPVSPVPVAPTIATAIASRSSKLFHMSADCADAKRIKLANRVTGDEARRGRRPHEGCPRRE